MKRARKPNRKAKLTEEVKAERARQRMLNTTRKYSVGTYIRKFVAPVFQQMIRAEAAAKPAGPVFAVVTDKARLVHREIGQCVCVTCGRVGPWKGDTMGGGPIETGHFLASRRASIVLEETNAHPQCPHCNRHLGGNQGAYREWMRQVYGQEEIDRLTRLKNTTRHFAKDELVDLRIAFAARLRAAEERIGGVRFARYLEENTDE